MKARKKARIYMTIIFVCEILMFYGNYNKPEDSLELGICIGSAFVSYMVLMVACQLIVNPFDNVYVPYDTEFIYVHNRHILIPLCAICVYMGDMVAAMIFITQGLGLDLPLMIGTAVMAKWLSLLIDMVFMCSVLASFNSYWIVVGDTLYKVGFFGGMTTYNLKNVTNTNAYCVYGGRGGRDYVYELLFQSRRVTMHGNFLTKDFFRGVEYIERRLGHNGSISFK